MKIPEWKSHWIRGGKVGHLAWVGKDILAWCSGVHIVFYDVVRRSEVVESFVKHSRGEGVCCLSGHLTLPIFAFAEKVSNPRVLIYTYPEIELVSEFLQGGPSGYLATAFTEHEQLVTLASYPHFALSVWSWRSGERLATISTHIKDLNAQRIATTCGGQTMIAQLGKESGKLSVWQMRICGKILSLKSRDVILPRGERVNAATWSPEPGPPTLAILDEDCQMYVLSHDATFPSKIAQTQRCSECTEIEASDICWYRGGLVLKTTFCQIRYYKKTSERSHWSRLWMVKLHAHPYVLTSHPFRNDRLFFHTLEGDLVQIVVPEDSESSTPDVATHLRRGSSYRYLNWIYPSGQHIMAVDNGAELSVLETNSGREVSRINLGMSGVLSRLTTRKDLPLAALTSHAGELVLVGLCDPKEPLILANFHLHREEFDLLKFSYCGNHLTAGFSLAGTFFCVACKVGAKIEVTARLEANRQISDVLLYDTPGHLRLFALCVTSKYAVVGNQILLYDLPNGQTRFSAASYVLELLDNFQNLKYCPVSQNEVIGAPYLTRQIQVLGIQAWKEVILLEATPSDHQLRHTRIFTDNNWITTCSCDGLVIVRKGDRLKKRVAVVMPHHRKDHGTIKGIMKPSGDVIVSVGHDGSLVCTKLFNDIGAEDSDSNDFSSIDLIKDSEYRTRASKDDSSTLDPSIVKFLTQPTVYFASEEDRGDKTWLEWSRSLRIAEEKKAFATERSAVQDSFASLKTIVTKLMNNNETCSEVEKLPVSVFDLDKVSRDQKLKAARDEREDVRCELEWNCAGMDRVSDWLIKFCWDKQQVQGQSIYTIFGKFNVPNYPTVASDPSETDALAWARFSKEFVNDVTESNATFHPWMTQSFNVVREQHPSIRRDTILSMLDEKQRIDAILEEDEEDTVIDEVELENQRTLEGMTTYRFIEHSEHYYSQFELYSYAQMTIERLLLRHEKQLLRAHFNKLFEDMHAIKEREMSFVLERNERIRYIDAELSLMFDQRVPEIPIDPVWDQTEKPESLIKVLDSEVKVAPYISPSTQELLDRQAAEENRLRLLLLADDFRERALMAMMDGVLEVRWEDVIKKDVPKPQCMLTKKPETYTAEDILAIQQYEKDVETLMQEREKYKRILETDYSKVNGALRDGIERFKQRLEEFFVTRVRVESAIQQVRLRYWRGCYREMRRQQMYEKEENLKSMMAEKEAEIASLSEEVRGQQSAIADLRSQHEAACNREKWQEKKFRSEFPGLAKATNDLLMRHYKRRPRMLQKPLPPTYLKELGKTAANTTKPILLTSECVEYLKGLDALDVRPTTLPPSVDTLHWEHLTRLRRNKIEIEMRIKALLVEIAEAEHTVADFNKLIGNARMEIEVLREKLNAEHQVRMLFDQDIEVQFVLKMGQIEVSLKSDGATGGSIFIPRSEIEYINSVILTAGGSKLKTMKRTINFGRGINFKEWEHKMLKMRIEDLREELYCVERIMVTREVQDYLKRKARGFKDDKTQQQFEKELETMRRNWEKQLTEWFLKLEAVQARIKAIRKNNSILDKRITEMNVARCEMELKRDVLGEAQALEYRRRKMDVVVERSRLVRKLQDNYAEQLELQTEYELLRLRRFPAFKFFKTLDDESTKRH